jgi:hypothetical protein
MSFKAVAGKASRPGSFISQNPKIMEERKVFSIVSGANTERSRKKRKLSEDQNTKKEHYIKSIKSILKDYNLRKKTAKNTSKKASLKPTSEEPKISISPSIIEQLSELRIEAANVAAQLNNQLFQLKKAMCTSCLQVTDYYDRLMEVVSTARSQHKALIEKSQAAAIEQLSRYLHKTEANLQVLDSLLEVFSKEAKIQLGDAPVLLDIVEQARLPALQVDVPSVSQKFDLRLKDRLAAELLDMVTLSEPRPYSQTFDTLNGIASKVISGFGWPQNLSPKQQEYVSNTGSTETKRRERSEGNLEADRLPQRFRTHDMAEASRPYKGSFHQQTYSLTRDKQSAEDLTCNINYKTGRFATGH